MSRQPTDFQKRDRRWVKEGRGQGRGEQYKRWLNIQDLAKSNSGQRHLQGTLIRPQGRVIKREYHLASHLETKVFDLFDNLDVASWGIEVLDILEQFPLLSVERTKDEPAGDTIAIAQELGVLHIPANQPNSPTVMTTDLMIKAKWSNQQLPMILALAIKPTSALENQIRRDRTLEKLEIEMLYWERHTFDGLPVHWQLVTEQQTPDDLITTLRQLGTFKNLAGPQLPSPADLSFIQNTCLDISNSDLSLSRVARQLDQQLRLPYGLAINVIYHLIANHQLQVDLSKPLLPEKPLALLNPAVEEKCALT